VQRGAGCPNEALRDLVGESCGSKPGEAVGGGCLVTDLAGDLID
jgi:hypothetical protein